MYQLEIVRMGELHPLHASRCLVALDHVLLSYDREVRLVRQQTQHDQISVRAVEAMPGVRVVLRIFAQLADVVEHFMFALSWHRAI